MNIKLLNHQRGKKIVPTVVSLYQWLMKRVVILLPVVLVFSAQVEDHLSVVHTFYSHILIAWAALVDK